jgi:hypothetical protein
MEFVRKYSPFEEAWTVTGIPGNAGCGAACRLDTRSFLLVTTGRGYCLTVGDRGRKRHKKYLPFMCE